MYVAEDQAQAAVAVEDVDDERLAAADRELAEVSRELAARTTSPLVVLLLEHGARALEARAKANTTAAAASRPVAAVVEPTTDTEHNQVAEDIDTVRAQHEFDSGAAPYQPEVHAVARAAERLADEVQAWDRHEQDLRRSMGLIELSTQTTTPEVVRADTAATVTDLLGEIAAALGVEPGRGARDLVAGVWRMRKLLDACRGGS